VFRKESLAPCRATGKEISIAKRKLVSLVRWEISLPGLLDKVRDFLCEHKIGHAAMVSRLRRRTAWAAPPALPCSARNRPRPLLIPPESSLRGEERDAIRRSPRNCNGKCRPAFWRVCGSTAGVGAGTKSAGENLERRARTSVISGGQVCTWEAGAAGRDWPHCCDQAETVLQPLVRGTGSRTGRHRPRRALATHVEVIRPLLDVTGVRCWQFLEQVNQTSRQDSSIWIEVQRQPHSPNYCPCWSRVNPAVAEIFCRLARQAHGLRQEEKARAARSWTKANCPAPARCDFRRGAFARRFGRQLAEICGWSGGARTAPARDGLSRLDPCDLWLR